jgi:hypothetical protein
VFLSRVFPKARRLKKLDDAAGKSLMTVRDVGGKFDLLVMD